MIARDYYNLSRFHKRHPELVAMPLRLGIGKFSLPPSNVHENGIYILAVEWLGDYIEFKDDNENGIDRLILNRYGRLQDPVGAWQLKNNRATSHSIVDRLAKNLVELAEYRPSENKVSFVSQVHLGAGDFMFRPLEGGRFDLKLVTARYLERNASPADFMDYLLGNRLFFISNDNFKPVYFKFQIIGRRHTDYFAHAFIKRANFSFRKCVIERPLWDFMPNFFQERQWSARDHLCR